MRLLTGLAALSATLLFSPSPSWACGGFFCRQAPVLQTAERVVFEIADDDTIVAYVQLQYQGADPNFAWVVPVPDVPTVEVGVGAEMFDALDAQTRPAFVSGVADSSVPATDDGGTGCSGGFGDASFGEPSLSARSLPVPEVEIWDQATVGPFEYAVISADNAEDLNDWLRINGYRVVPGSDGIVQDYLDDGMKLLGLKLAPDADATQVEPIKLTYQDSRGCGAIPVKLTAIAATPGLEILTWVFGAYPAKSMNFPAVEISGDDVWSPTEYGPALARAVDRAGGHGMVTEYAQPTSTLTGQGSAELEALLSRHAYVTRLRTELDPDEMTVDPMFVLDPFLADVSNRFQLGGGGFEVTSGMVFGILAFGLGLRRRRR